MNQIRNANVSRAVGLIVAGALAVVGLSGCAPTRSVDAFCAVMEDHKQTYLDQMAAASDQGLGGMVQAISAVGDLKLMWKELAEVAPDEIKADAEAVRDAWQKQEDNAGAGDWMSSLTTALLNSGSMSRVDAYVRHHCDAKPDAAAGELAPGEATPTLTPEPEAVILTDEWTNRTGYSYSLELNTAVGTASKDIANAAPGNANITSQYSFTGTLTNTTPERNAPSPDYIKVQPIWSADNLVCALGGMGIGSGFSSNTPGRAEAWCTLSSMPYTLRAASSDIEIGSTADVQAFGGGIVPLVVPEDQADAIMAALAAPTAWVLGRNSGEGRLTDCLLESGGYYLSRSTIDTGCTE